MEFFEVVTRRRAVRAFRGEPVDTALLEQMLAAANRAPSAANLQAYEIVLGTRRPVKEALARAAHNQGFLAEASMVLAFVTNPRRSLDIEAVATDLLNTSDEVAYALRQRGENLLCLQDATVA